MMSSLLLLGGMVAWQQRLGIVVPVPLFRTVRQSLICSNRPSSRSIGGRGRMLNAILCQQPTGSRIPTSSGLPASATISSTGAVSPSYSPARRPAAWGRRHQYASFLAARDSRRRALPSLVSVSAGDTNNDTATPEAVVESRGDGSRGVGKEDVVARTVDPTTKAKRGRKRRSGSTDKRREFIGMAKAVDRGQFSTTYMPRAADGTFEAKSGLPDRSKLFTVLGIESSCDDTGAAVVRSDGAILGESLASQNDIHEEFGGVVPGLARNAHVERIDEVVADALRRAGNMTMNDVDAVGVTVGPGLEICLRVGCNKARDLAIEYGKPFVGVHHLEAHILMARLPQLEGSSQSQVVLPATEDTHEAMRAVDFPFLALLVSGGHCQILKCLGIGQYEIIGGTIDDSLGEAFDKTARMLGLPVGGGGGPAVEKLAREGDPTAVPFPIPMRNRKDCDFSYSGLKTSVRTAIARLRKERGLGTEDDLPDEDVANLAASFQHVAICHIEQRLERCMSMLEEEGVGIRSLAVVGGVAANSELRLRLKELCDARPDPWTMFVPPPRLCTDQGSMSAWAAIERIMVGSTDEPEGHEVFARFPFADGNE